MLLVDIDLLPFPIGSPGLFEVLDPPSDLAHMLVGLDVASHVQGRGVEARHLHARVRDEGISGLGDGVLEEPVDDNDIAADQFGPACHLLHDN